MSKTLWDSLLVRADVFGVFLVFATAGAIASPTPRAIATKAPTVKTQEVQSQTETPSATAAKVAITTQKTNIEPLVVGDFQTKAGVAMTRTEAINGIST